MFGRRKREKHAKNRQRILQDAAQTRANGMMQLRRAQQFSEHSESAEIVIPREYSFQKVEDDPDILRLEAELKRINKAPEQRQESTTLSGSQRGSFQGSLPLLDRLPSIETEHLSRLGTPVRSDLPGHVESPTYKDPSFREIKWNNTPSHVSREWSVRETDSPRGQSDYNARNVSLNQPPPGVSNGGGDSGGGGGMMYIRSDVDLNLIEQAGNSPISRSGENTRQVASLSVGELMEQDRAERRQRLIERGRAGAAQEAPTQAPSTREPSQGVPATNQHFISITPTTTHAIPSLSSHSHKSSPKPWQDEHPALARGSGDTRLDIERAINTPSAIEVKMDSPVSNRCVSS